MMVLRVPPRTHAKCAAEKKGRDGTGVRKKMPAGLPRRRTCRRASDTLGGGNGEGGEAEEDEEREVRC